MNIFHLRHRWETAGNDEPDLRQTMCRLELQIGDVLLTENEDIFSQTISPSVLVSAYPLAQWFAANWWRLTSEPLPPTIRPLTSWRMAHEIGAANSGYVWPQILFATDREVMQVWAAPSRGNREQSVRYLNGLTAPVALSMLEFEKNVELFIQSVIARLAATGLHDTSLKLLWDEVLEERRDAETSSARRCEAELGYDPDECPDDILSTAIRLKSQMGEATLSELTPVYGKSEISTSIYDLDTLIKSEGIPGSPALPKIRARESKSMAPWERAVEDARLLRKELHNTGDRVSTEDLYSLLGIRKQDAEHYNGKTGSKVAIAVPGKGRQIAFMPRRRHPRSKRFELARFIGDIVYTHSAGGEWLASTDLSTSRQKYQRAFAAEFLCPIENLTGFLEDDFSEDRLEDAAEHFEISPETVNSLLANNALIYRTHGLSGLPYTIA